MQKAFKWIASAHGTEFGGDTSRIVLMGNSAVIATWRRYNAKGKERRDRLKKIKLQSAERASGRYEPAANQKIVHPRTRKMLPVIF